MLEFPWAYRFLGRILGPGSRRRLIDEYFRPNPGDRILDLGCGPGDALMYLSPAHYIGIDMNPGYIRAAAAQYGSKAGVRFHCTDATKWEDPEPGSYDLVMANGILHHLNDAQAEALLNVAAGCLKPSGRLVANDGCYVANQSRLARLLLRMDRGGYIREPAAYCVMARRRFSEVESAVLHDLLRVPYTTHLMICKKPLTN